MNRRTFLGTLAGSLLAAPLVAEAQTAGKIYRIGQLLAFNSASDWKSDPRHLALVQALREFGWVEGQNIVFEFRSAEGTPERLPSLASELVRLNVDLILMSTISAAIAAKNATTTIPIVIVQAGDPVGSGLVTSLAQPGGNVTGQSYGTTLLSAKSLALLKELVPQATRVAILRDPANPALREYWIETETAAQTLRVTLLPVDIRGPADYEHAFGLMRQAQTHALVARSGGPDRRPKDVRRFVDLAAKYRLPALYGSKLAVEAGGLMSYAPDQLGLFRGAARYIDRILKAPSPPTCPSSSRPSSSWSSISKPPRPSASRSPNRCCCERTG